MFSLELSSIMRSVADVKDGGLGGVPAPKRMLLLLLMLLLLVLLLPAFGLLPRGLLFISGLLAALNEAMGKGSGRSPSPKSGFGGCGGVSPNPSKGSGKMPFPPAPLPPPRAGEEWAVFLGVFLVIGEAISWSCSDTAVMF